jgi:hypothetical protein
MPRTVSSDAEVLAWCVVANVAAETSHGEGGQEVRRGLKHFAPGAKVWVLPPQWGDGGESVFVVGRHRGRGRGRLARMVVARHHLVNFRVRGIYSPAVHRELTQPWKQQGDHSLCLWKSQEEAERATHWWNTEQVTQSGVSRPRRRGDLIAVLARLATAAPAWPWPWPLSADAARRLTEELVEEPRVPADAIGDILRDRDEADATNFVLDPLRDIVDDLGPPGADLDYRNHPRWTDVVTAAGRAHALLNSPPRADQDEELGKATEQPAS